MTAAIAATPAPALAVEGAMAGVAAGHGLAVRVTFWRLLFGSVYVLTVFFGFQMGSVDC
jgi:hypothetical protein